VRTVPFVRFFLYYALLIAAAITLIQLVPAVRQAFIAPIAISGVGDELPFTDAGTPGTRSPATLQTPSVQPAPAGSADEIVERTITTLLITLGALSLVLPVAWVYMFTRRLRYDPSLAQSVMVLPPVVAGITVVVKNSIALAFSLAGIVAAVRFRNTLKDPKDAVFVFLAIGIGLAAGVQALDVALVMSFSFNLLVLLLWKYNLAAVYSGVSDRQAALSVGDQELLRVRRREQREHERELADRLDSEIEPDGMLLVHSAVPETARRALEVSLESLAKEWQWVEEPEWNDKVATLRVLVQLRKKTDPAELLGEVDDRWAPYVAAAEYVSLRPRSADEEE